MPDRDGIAVLTDTVELKAIDVDNSNCWKPSSIFVKTQEVAEMHMRVLNCSHDDLADRGVFFVLMRQKFRMNAYPVFSQKVSISTWVSTERSFFPRYFMINDEQGNQLGSVSTVWMLCGLKERNIVRPSQSDVDFPPIPIPALENPGKLHFSGDPDLVVARESKYSDMDYNGHVNNTRYIDWVCDLFDPERYLKQKMSELQINYVSEVRDREEFLLELKETENNFSVQCKSRVDDRTVFIAAGKWD